MNHVSERLTELDNNPLSFRLSNPTLYYLQQQQQQQQPSFDNSVSKFGISVESFSHATSTDIGFSESMSDMLSAASSPDLVPQGVHNLNTIDPTLLQLNGMDRLSMSPPVKYEMVSPELHAMDFNRQHAVAAAMAAAAAANGISSPLMGPASFDDDLALNMGASPTSASFLSMQQQFDRSIGSVPLAHQNSGSVFGHNDGGGTNASSGDEFSTDGRDTNFGFSGLPSSNASVPPMDVKTATNGGRYLRYAAGSVVGVPIAGAPAGASIIGGPGGNFQSMSMPVNLGMGTGAAGINGNTDWFGSPTTAAAAAATAAVSGLDVGSFPGMHTGNTMSFGAANGGSGPASGPASAGELSLINSMFDPEDIKNAHKQAQLMYEKRRRRRESHNAVERRRRDNINEKIQELAILLPDCNADPNNKPNKGAILRKSVDYIRRVQQVMHQQNQRNQELEALVAQLQRERGMSPTNTGGSVVAAATSNGIGTTNAIPIPSMSTSSSTVSAAILTSMGMAPMAMSLTMVAPGTPLSTSSPSITADPVSVTASRSS
ncbi:helix-loop-helix DNA-binding domain-containing protein [Syncephalis fuscata]|nr:helix-loop-helix DNA-binding domain-containing protein [Syncephalis fuscata]